MLEGNLSAMLASSQNGLDKQEKTLLKLFRSLPADQQQTLLAFAEFLGSRQQGQATSESLSVEIPAPEPIERPGNESVVAAMKRLTATYPMVEKSVLLNEASALMAQHVLQGRGAVEVIDELEALFANSYQAMKGGQDI